MKPVFCVVRVLTTLLLFLAPAGVVAEPVEAPSSPVVSRIVWSNQTSTRVNPLGLGNQTRLGFQRGLYVGENVLTRDNFWHVGGNLFLSPARLRVAAVAEVRPVSLLTLRASAGYTYYLGTFRAMQSRPSAQDDLSDAAMVANRNGPLGNYATFGTHVELEPTLQLAWGRWLMRDRAMWGWYNAALRAGDRVWRDPLLDVTVANNGWVFTNDVDVLYRITTGPAMFAVGLRHALVRPFYPEEASAETRNGQQRLGVLVAYTFFDRGDVVFDRPTLAVNVGRYLTHPYRAEPGLSAQNLFVTVGFAFHGQIWRN